jgi:hypothetical protein
MGGNIYLFDELVGQRCFGYDLFFPCTIILNIKIDGKDVKNIKNYDLPLCSTSGLISTLTNCRTLFRSFASQSIQEDRFGNKAVSSDPVP